MKYTTEKKSTPKNIVALLGLAITLLVGAFCYYEQSMLGFPDGHLTSYDIFYKKKLFPIFFSLNAIFFLVFTAAVFLKKKSKRLLILYIGLAFLCILLEYYFSIHIKNEQIG